MLPFDVNELMESIAQNIAQQVQTQMTELEERIDHRIGQLANELHLRMGDLEQRIYMLETRSRKSSSRRHESKKSLVSKNPRVPVSASFSSTPISVSQVPVTPVRTTPTSISWLPSTSVVAPVSPAVKSKPNHVLPESSSILGSRSPWARRIIDTSL
jgi:hypothetical protein